jgi:hypothetical protein
MREMQFVWKVTLIVLVTAMFSPTEPLGCFIRRLLRPTSRGCMEPSSTDEADE